MLFAFAVFASQAVGQAPTGPQPKPGEVVEVEISPTVRMKFCWIPPGETALGSPKNEQDYVISAFHMDVRYPHMDWELASKRGTFKTKGFWLGKYPITQAEWNVFMTEPEFRGRYFNTALNTFQQLGIKNTDDYSVENISWNDANKYIERLAKATKLPKAFAKGKFAMPHEDQWEYAARGGKGNQQPFCHGHSLDSTQANFNGKHPYGPKTEKGPWLARLVPVGTYEKQLPHPWDLCDMAGNVWQWCENKHPEYNSDDRVVRGGAFNTIANECRPAYRATARPPTYRNLDVGVRLAFIPEP
jgi:formylglycine-generating enzyme required for sulfatase activity